MINTNGIRLARDDAFLEAVAALKHRTEIYLQFDGFRDDGYQQLRGVSLLETKLQAIERLGEAGLNTILVCTVQPNINEDELWRMVEFGMQRPWITGVSFQPATYSGRYVLPEELDQRVTFPDIIHGLEKQSAGVWKATDFSPLPCAHPNGHTLAYAFRDNKHMLPLARFVDLENHLDLLSGRITFNRERARELIAEYLSRQPCGIGGCPPNEQIGMDAIPQDLSADDLRLAGDFFQRAMTEQLDPADMFRITTTSFMDAYNFDIRQLMKSCVHFILPSGHLIPFSAYNVLYRGGHVPLPPLTTTVPLKC